MLTKELFSICTFYAVSPIHAGCGASTSAVDLPIQRERHTNWPHVQASGVKGSFRDHYRRFATDKNADLINLIFGSDRDNDKEKKGADDNLPGAISVSDAKLLAFPVRSNVAPFVWVTSPSILRRFGKDLEFTGLSTLSDIPDVNDEKAISLSGKIAEEVILEDAVVNVVGENTISFPDGFPALERLLLVSDEMFDYCVSSCTEIQTQIKIDSETGTAAGGALRYQELLPADSVLYSIVYYSRSSDLNELQADMIQRHIEDVISGFIQIGGDETLGRGICKIAWVKKEDN